MASSSLTADEAAVYDRQIRVWGMEAQGRLRGSRVLVCGALGLAAEVCKNIVLAGIGSLVLMDPAKVQESDLAANFFLTTQDLGANRAQACIPRIQSLNPNVKVEASDKELESLAADFLEQFDCVVLTLSPLSQQIRINEMCRHADKNILFFAAEALGFYAYCLQDLGHHNYCITEKGQTVHKTIAFQSLSETLAVSWSKLGKVYRRSAKPMGQLLMALQVLHHFRDDNGAFPSPADVGKVLSLRDEMCKRNSVDSSMVPDDTIRAVLSTITCELCPVCAVFGGLMGQEILKAISGKGAPEQNVILFDANEGSAVAKFVQ